MGVRNQARSPLVAFTDQPATGRSSPDASAHKPHVLNDVSVSEKLPTVFKPVSPPPYLNGGPHEFLCWVIESEYNYIDPEWIAQELQNRMPRPVDDLAQWNDDSDEDDASDAV